MKELTYKQEVVLEFIDNFSTFNHVWSVKEYEEFRKLFTQGYCWHFAKMLQATFGRGTVCVAFHIAHMVWVDTDGTAYDIEMNLITLSISQISGVFLHRRAN